MPVTQQTPEPEDWGWDDDDVDEATAAARAQDDHRTKVIALGGLAVVVAIVALVIALVRLVDTGAVAPGNPSDAAAQWANALLHGHHTRQHQLECAAGSDSGNVLSLVSSGHGTVRAEAAVRTGVHRWHVPLDVPDLGAGSYAVDVVQQRGRYLVC